MNTFLKANVASLTASGCDFLLTVIAVQYLQVDKLYGSIFGTVCGGIINFIICRNWVFEMGEGGLHFQGRKYFITWVGNLLLNASGVYVYIRVLEMNYVLSKLVVSLVVSIIYNYPMQKRYVFRKG